jgi:hypothetical protein
MELKSCHEEILFAIEVHGYAPEFWPAVAFRKSGGAKEQSKQGRQKEINCPYCGELFMIVAEKRRLDLVRFKKRVRVKCHEYRKCKMCYEHIGIVYLADKTA